MNVEKRLRFHNSIFRFSVEQTVKVIFIGIYIVAAFIGQFPFFEFC